MAKILILGAGFAGLAAADALSSVLERTHEITMVSAGRRFTFFPALVPMVFGEFSSVDVSAEIAPPLEAAGIRFVNGAVLGIDPDRKRVQVKGPDIDGELEYDKLIIALGRSLNVEKVPGFFEYSHHLLSVKAAQAFKSAVDEFRTGNIVVGLCPDGMLPIPVCESAIALAERFADRVASRSVTVTAVFPETLDRALAGAGIFRDIQCALESRGVRIVPDFRINQVSEAGIMAPGKPTIPFDLLMLMPPFRGNESLRSLFPDARPEGFASVNNKMQVVGLKDVYAAGDIVSFDGPRYGYMAMRQGKVAAINAFVELCDETPTVEYKHELEWVIGERYTHSHFFHYGVWDDTLADFADDALLGLAKRIRDRYGYVLGAAGSSV
jgi:NADH dehydrogenase FAD-containing subunit